MRFDEASFHSLDDLAADAQIFALCYGIISNAASFSQ
jgi:hypothetical protein